MVGVTGVGFRCRTLFRAVARFRGAASRLAQFGIETFGLNLTRPHFAVPAPRVIAPGLQPMPSEFITPRLADMIARTGGGTTYTDGVALI